ncbi:MAG: helix-turn-helix domain-containing protein [Limnochordales bacterium]|nr:hypothetical protein [Bacillota bacterium]
MSGESKDRWLTLSDVAAMLGVHEGTVRRWADSGRLPSYRTPGGHRRFRREDVIAFLAERRMSSDPGLPQPLPPNVSRVLQQAHHDIRSLVQSQRWYAYYDESRSSHRRATGQRLLALLLHYTSRSDEGEVYLHEAKRMMRDYGREAYLLGMSLPDTAQAYLFFRRALINVVARDVQAPDPDSIRLLDRMHRFWDDLLLALIEGYTEARIV